MKVDTKVLDNYTKKEVRGFNKEVSEFLWKKKRTISKDAVAFFYLRCYQLEHEEVERAYSQGVYEMVQKYGKPGKLSDQK